MAIVKMKKFRLLTSRAHKDDVLRELMLLGCVEVSEPEPLLDDPELKTLVEREKTGLDVCQAEYAKLNHALDIIANYVPVKSGLFPMKPEITDQRLFDENDTENCLALAKLLISLDDGIRKLHAEQSSTESLIESLLPWESHKLPLDYDGTASAAVIIGAIPAAFDIEELKYALNEATAEAEAFLLSSNRELHYLCIVCLRDVRTIVSEVLRRFNFSLSSLKTLRGTAAANIKAKNARLKEIDAEKAALEAKITVLAEQKEKLRLCCDHVNTKIARAEASEKLLGTESSLLLTGWAKAASEPDLMVNLSKYACAWEFEEPSPDEYADVPVELKNNPLTRPLSMVTEMYSLPAYGTVDPNPPMMPFFVLFYGLMMADMGYGLIMTIAAILVKRKKPKGGMKTFFDLLLLCGISTFVIGLITGGFFGDAPDQIAGVFGATFVLTDLGPAWWPLFTPLGNTVEVLVGALALGMIHILFGMGIAFVQNIKNGKAFDAFCDIMSWWILFAGIALWALGVTKWVAIAGGAIIVLTGGRKSANIFGKITGGIGALYNITGYFGDILSYSRVMALMLAGGVIASVFNTLGALTGNIVTFLLIFVIGHALNFALNLLGCYVHDMRLQCLEFFGKFYEDGGKPFNPLKVKTKYNEVVNE